MNKVRLRDVLTVKRGASLPGEFYSNTGEYIRLTLGNFAYPGGGFKANTSKKDLFYIGEIRPEFILKKGDIITPLTEQVRGLLGETATIPKDNTYIQSGDIGLIIPNENLLNKRYAYYLISSPIIKKQLDAGSQQTKIRHTSPEAIMNCIAYIPDIDEQLSIASFLDKTNKKIETNNAIISELESMAKDIYDYWFVQFDFPDENGKPYKSSGGKMVWNEELKREIPEGWSNCTLEKLVNIVRGVTYEEGDTVDRPDKDHIMLLRANNIANEKINLDKVTFVSKDRVSAQQILIPGDILICMSSGSKEHVGKTAELPFDEKMTFGAFCSKIRCNDDIFRPFVNRTIKSNLFNTWVKQKALGTNINNLTNEIISSMPIVYPTKQIISRFHTLLCPIISKIYSVAKESRELTSLRDFLLPLLMNGQVKIGDMEA